MNVQPFVVAPYECLHVKKEKVFCLNSQSLALWRFTLKVQPFRITPNGRLNPETSSLSSLYRIDVQILEL